MKAVNDRVIVQKAFVKERTVGGILIPVGANVDAKIKLNVGRVLSCGPGLRFSNGECQAPSCADGDVIMWEQFGDINAEVLGTNRVAVRYEDIMAVLEPGEYDNYVFDVEAYKKEEDARSALVIAEQERLRSAVTPTGFKCVNSFCKKSGEVVPVETCEHCGKPTEKC